MNFHHAGQEVREGFPLRNPSLCAHGVGFIATQYHLLNHYLLITDPSIARLEDLQALRTQKVATIKTSAKYTRQRDPDVLNKFYDEMAADLPRTPYVDEVSARTTIDAMQAQGPPLAKVDVKGIFDNSDLKALETSGFVDKLSPR